MTDLTILGSEVIQTIQRFDYVNGAEHNNGAEYNNSVKLVANRRTLVRVYVDSGNGGKIPNVTGCLIVETSGGIKNRCSPIHKDQVITARPVIEIKREDLTHTLNFVLSPPNFDLSGQVKITPEIWVNGSEKDKYKITGETISPIFHRRRSQNLNVMTIRDNIHNIGAPTKSDFCASLEGARARYPISENGFDIEFPQNYLNIDTNYDLTKNSQWKDFLDEIDFYRDECENLDVIWAVMVPNNNMYAINGLATIGEGIFGSQVFIVKANMPASFAHEMAHNFELRDLFDIDYGWPTKTEEIGWKGDLTGGSLIPAETPELMSFGDEDRWPSIAFWEYIFNKLSN